jgi:hypothetical protein
MAVNPTTSSHATLSINTPSSTSPRTRRSSGTPTEPQTLGAPSGPGRLASLTGLLAGSKPKATESESLPLDNRSLPTLTVDPPVDEAPTPPTVDAEAPVGPTMTGGASPNQPPASSSLLQPPPSPGEQATFGSSGRERKDSVSSRRTEETQGPDVAGSTDHGSRRRLSVSNASESGGSAAPAIPHSLSLSFTDIAGEQGSSAVVFAGVQGAAQSVPAAGDMGVVPLGDAAGAEWLATKGKLEEPDACEGKLSGSGANVSSDNRLIRELIGIARKRDPNIALPDNTSVRFEPPKFLAANHARLRDHYTINKLLLKSGGTKETRINLTLALLRRFLLEGRSAFGRDAIIRRQSGEPGVPAYDWLVKIGRGSQVRTGELAGGPLQEAFEAKLQEDDETAARVGAAWIHSLETNKYLGWENLAAIAIAEVNSAGLGALIEELAITRPLKSHFGKNFVSNDLPIDIKRGLVFGDAASAIPIETIDATLVDAFKNFIDTRQKELPSFEQVVDGFKAGLVSFLGALPSSALSYFSTGSLPGDAILNLLANQLAVFSSGWILPMGQKSQEDETQAALVESIASGYMGQVPSDQKPRDFLRNLTREVMMVSPGSQTAQKALALTSLIGLAPFLVGQFGHVTAETQALLQRTIFNPIETLAMNSVIVFSKHLGLPDRVGGQLFTTDTQKERALMALVLNKSTTSNKTITPKDLSKIFQPLEDTLGFGPSGRGINRGLTSLISLYETGTHALRGGTPLSRDIDYDRTQGDTNV